jgi:uncharacterized protein YndB with AHSA1/START domain
MTTVSVERDLEIPAPPERVWEQIADPGTWSHWSVNHVSFSGAVPELVPGARFGEHLQVRKAPAEVAWTVEEASAPTRLLLRGKGPFAMKVEHSYTVAAAGDGARVTVALSLSATALRPMAGALTKELARNLPETLERLRDRLVTAPATA